MTIDDIKSQIAAGKTVRQVITEAIERAKADPYNAVLSVIEKRALERADAIDNKLANHEGAGRLAGVPFLAKDNILTFDCRTTASAHMLENFEAPYQATVIERLEAAGAICIGKTNLDAFAHGGSTENSFFGPTKNIADAERVAGGSSGGSAVAVASGIVPFALGSDTGGSIRQPASYNGIYGMKPTYGSVSRYGVVAMASSTDVVGPLATTIDDIQLVLDSLRGVDEHDSTTIPIDDLSLAVADSITVGVIEQSIGDGVDPEVQSLVEKAIAHAKDKGHAIKVVSLPSLTYALAVYYIVVPAELTSNLARYDGIKYGTSASGATLADVYANSRTVGFMDENKRRILIGNYVLSSGYYDAYYKKAQTVRTIIINEYRKAFETCDVLIGPTAPTPAFRLGENTDDPLQMYLADIMTVPASLAGLPTLSIPIGSTSAGLPVGMQITGPQRQDYRVLRAAEIWKGMS
ncbi:Asp-tRNA(Asn)/Glu-tRNA(Gln) amidotransferase subunit GatA [Candidatus Saccharibacteria bacterium]|nr:Asp-tRNA(Asn)/Glu-tRNA(Gln) amidotransferase subunit GatA [Candidatus Saccharibacteria bacterium]